MSNFVSVIVPVYNGATYINKTVDSLLQQTYTDFEVILINDGSTDCSAQIINDLASTYESVRAFHKENGGVACARNFGIDKAKGDLIAFCDQDDLWLPNKLEHQVPLFENEAIGLVYCGAIAHHTNDNREVRSDFSSHSRGMVFDQLIYENMFTCCTVIARKSAILAVGGFDEDRSLMGVDDWHLWLKIANQFEFDFAEKHLAIHVFHGENYSSNDEKMHAAELVCLDKIRDSIDLSAREVDWSKVKSEVHKKYAACYLYNSDFRKAGRSLKDANAAFFDFKVLIKSILLLILPTLVLSYSQKLKRRK
ncbi:glycosyltransferase family A protein [Alkalimonas collagenimarina]|uniref:Glycosyltransferase family A protein n=1 Tax=Alkalimonas collagenimarina TaxID=400390 RepID=A0ABT9H0A4_9GAMM|nr:glycosyltransferase family A protein [Alkalimonas collagenimarina]MDP4536365.1 glycosyltransferase family A protein [Alkalimonas collagenimarina]